MEGSDFRIELLNRAVLRRGFQPVRFEPTGVAGSEKTAKCESAQFAE